MWYTLRGSDDRERGLASRSRRRGEQLDKTGERERADATLIATALEVRGVSRAILTKRPIKRRGEELVVLVRGGEDPALGDLARQIF